MVRSNDLISGGVPTVRGYGGPFERAVSIDVACAGNRARTPSFDARSLIPPGAPRGGFGHVRWSAVAELRPALPRRPPVLRADDV